MMNYNLYKKYFMTLNIINIQSSNIYFGYIINLLFKKGLKFKYFVTFFKFLIILTLERRRLQKYSKYTNLKFIQKILKKIKPIANFRVKHRSGKKYFIPIPILSHQERYNKAIKC